MPILTQNTLEFISRSPDQTRRLGARLGDYLDGSEVIALEGGLGTGKTVFAQGIGRGWGASSRLVSPTYVLVRRHLRYQDDLRLYHIDLYRLNSTMEIEGLGLEGYMGEPDTVCIIEWADRHRGIVPDDHLWVNLRFLDEYRRSLTFRAHGSHHQAILERYRQEILGL